MKNLLFIILIVMSSCKDGKDNKFDTSEKIDPDTINVDSVQHGNLTEEKDAMHTETESMRTAADPITVNYGRYRKMIKDKAADDCNCNCIEIDYDRATEWCIVKDKVYISARTQKTGDNTADVYFVASSREMSPDRAFPWDEFDKNSPLATLTFQPDGSAKLDWLGFSKNGEVITDYALYGKKTLEGIYKKE